MKDRKDIVHGSYSLDKIAERNALEALRLKWPQIAKGVVYSSAITLASLKVNPIIKSELGKTAKVGKICFRDLKGCKIEGERQSGLDDFMGSLAEAYDLSLTAKNSKRGRLREYELTPQISPGNYYGPEAALPQGRIPTYLENDYDLIEGAPFSALDPATEKLVNEVTKGITIPLRRRHNKD